jgi:hypothetical protein
MGLFLKQGDENYQTAYSTLHSVPLGVDVAFHIFLSTYAKFPYITVLGTGLGFRSMAIQNI